MVAPMKKALEEDPDFFCGQIIFQKDGYNMARRTPVASGLGRQLALLKEYGYEVVTAAELMEETPFADVGRSDMRLGRFIQLAKTRGIAYSDRKCADLEAYVGKIAPVLSIPGENEMESLAECALRTCRSGQAKCYGESVRKVERENGISEL